MSIFVSHSSLDKPWVRRLVNDLRDDDLPVWFDEDSILPGDSIPEAIASGIDSSKVVLIVLSAQSVKSGWVAEEISGALYRVINDKSRRIIPVLTEECEAPPMLAHRKHFDLTTYDDEISKLIEFLHSIAEVSDASHIDIPNYESFRLIGEGSFGVVFECISTNTNQKCALKLAKSPSLPLNLERSVHERLAGSRNIVKIIDHGTWQDKPFVVMPYVGRSLKWHLRHGKLYPDQLDGILDVAIGILTGLDEAHQFGIVHCDVKPSNILIDDLGRPILCDFGIARDLPNVHLTYSTVVRGTICYMSPEQQLALDLNQQTDIYSFGAVLYEMLTGDKPVGRFKDASAINPSIPPAIDAILNKCLETNKSQRYKKCEHVLKDLTAARKSTALSRRLRIDSELPEDVEVYSPVMSQVLKKLERVSALDCNVLLTGPTGCGKTLLAQWSHSHSPRHRQAFVEVNASAIPETLAVSSLFGHERGAFTGAAEKHRGYVEQADGGTLFVDEVADMPLEVQAYLLRILETGEFYRVGSDRAITVDVRWVFASNRDLNGLVADGRFRADLLYRISDSVSVPALRDRHEEIEPLMRTFASRLGIRLVIQPEARSMLNGFRWPGNVRSSNHLCDT